MTRRPFGSRITRPLLAALAMVLAATSLACSDDDPAEVVLITHSSFNISDELRQAFESDTGLTLTVRQGGDAVEALNQAVLTADNPQGDVFFGVDDITMTRALEADLFAPYTAQGIERVPDRLRLDPEDRLTPIDQGAVCVNYDAEWFADEGIPVPESLDDLADPTYRGLLVVQNPASSTPGLQFLTATIAEYGEDGWLDYWERLRDNDVLVTAGWSDAYYTAFSGPSSEGDRPLVVSYGSSPPFEVDDSGPLPDQGPTDTIESTCTRQVEFAGIFTHAENPEGARQLVDFLISDAFQAEIPMGMYVFPAVDSVSLPEVFERYATIPTDPYEVDPALVSSEQSRWIREWTDTVIR